MSNGAAQAVGTGKVGLTPHPMPYLKPILFWHALGFRDCPNRSLAKGVIVLLFKPLAGIIIVLALTMGLKAVRSAEVPFGEDN